MSAHFGIVLPLWSYAADGGAVLDRVAGEVGIDHVVVPAVTGAQAQFRLAPDLAEPYFHTEGGWHFPPNTKVYGASGVRPVKARWFGASDHLARLREHLQRLAVRLVLRIDLRSVVALAEQEPHLAQRNPWGQAVPLAGPCVGNPNLRELLRATIEDLQRYQPGGFELVEWVPDHAVNSQASRPVAWHLTGERLLDICFCAACRQIAERAGIDADQAARSTRVQFGRASDRPAREVALCAEDEVVAQYRAARLTDCGGWLRRGAEVDATHRYWLLQAHETRTHYVEFPFEVLLRLPARVQDYIEGQIAPALTWHSSGGRRGGWALPVWHPTFDCPAQLVCLLNDAAHAGIEIFDFEGLDEDPPEAVTWLKQAVRFARRG